MLCTRSLSIRSHTRKGHPDEPAPAAPRSPSTSAAGQRTFAPGRDVVIGRDIRADVRLVHPAVSPGLMRCFGTSTVMGRDRQPEAGTGYSSRDGRCRPADIRDGRPSTSATPTASRLTFELGHNRTGPMHRCRAHRRPRRGGAPPRSSAAHHRRPRLRQRHRHPGRVGRRASRHPGPDAAGSAHSGRRHRQRHVRQRRAGRRRLLDRRRCRHDRQRRLGFHGPQADPSDRQPSPPRRPVVSKLRDISLTVDGTVTLLDRISLTARPGIPHGGDRPVRLGQVHPRRTSSPAAPGPTCGAVSFEGHDIHAEYALLRSRIGMVPQDDVVHRQLTVNAGPGLRGRTSDAARHHRSRIGTGDRAGARRTRR